VGIITKGQLKHKDKKDLEILLMERLLNKMLYETDIQNRKSVLEAWDLHWDF
jgi:hypothetical protein